LRRFLLLPESDTRILLVPGRRQCKARDHGGASHAGVQHRRSGAGAWREAVRKPTARLSGSAQMRTIFIAFIVLRMMAAQSTAAGDLGAGRLLVATGELSDPN